ncbi:MAG: transglycosylase SLT domain-containing protein [Clostridiales bacterium]|nr:transglycosylase SLT domain-containing protein [Clostridiales bacterium]
MAENVIRHDVVQIDFLSDGVLKVLSEMNEEIEAIKKALGAIDDSDPLKPVKKGADDTRTEAQRLKDEFKAIAKIGFSGLKTGLKAVGSEAAKATKEAAKMTAALSADAVKKTAGLTVKGVAAASAGVGALVGLSVNAYGEYEQLVGGVDTLFGESSKLVQQYVNDAYKNAGLSANDYMETVTGFSASLLQSLGNDTEKAAVQANTAIVDMSDNANKMGSDMESIMNAYQGFAKSNYTMLDNLKLGYGGTQAEMERLLKDAGKLAGTTYSIDSFNDIIEAIHVMQESMGIAGTTEEEASDTIQGSLSALKSAWGNMLTGVVTGGDSFDQCLNNLVESAKTAGEQLMPAIRGGLEGVGTLIQELAPMITAELPGLVNDILPPLLSAATTVVKGIISALPSLISMLIKEGPAIIAQLIRAFKDVIPEIIGTIKASLPLVIESGKNTIKSFVSGIPGNMDRLLSAVGNLLKSFVLSVGDALPGIITAGYQLLGSFVSGILRGIPNIIDTAIWGVQNFIMGLNSYLPTILGTGFEIVTSLVAGIIKAIPQILLVVPKLVLSFLKLLFTTDWVEVGKSILKGIKKDIFGGDDGLDETEKDITKNLKAEVENSIADIDTGITFDTTVDTSALENISGSDISNSLTIDTSSISGATEDIVNQFEAIGENIRALPADIEGLLEPINTVVDKLIDMLRIFSEAFGFLPNYSADINYMSDIVTRLDSTLKKSGKNITKNIREMVINSREAIVDEISSLPKLMGEAIKKSGDSLSSAVIEIWQKAVKASVKPVNKLLEGANWILKQFGSSKSVAKWTPYAKGTEGHKGGNAVVNDGRGAELVQMPNGDSFIPAGRDIFIPNAPKGMKVLSAEDTAALMGRKTPTFKYGEGNIDIWDYIDNAADLVNSVKNKYVNYNGIKGLALSVGRGLVETVSGEMVSWVKNLFEELGAVSLANYNASGGVEQWRSTVIQALKMEGLYNEANVARTLYQMQTESGGNPYAINLWDSNAKKGIPSKGLMQVIDPTFKAYARPGYNSNIYDPLSNILAAVRYARARYGSLAAAFRGVGYADGGIAYKPSVFGEDGAEMAIPLKADKRDRALKLWAKTGAILGAGLSGYTPENAPVSNTNTVIEGDTYKFNSNITVNGSEKDRTTARYVKNAVKEGIQEFMDSFRNSNKFAREY